VLMVLIGGGLVSFWGPVIGTVIYFIARDLLGAYTETWLLWFGLMFMAMVMFKPEGAAGLGANLSRRLMAVRMRAGAASVGAGGTGRT
jgi:branched-chain amino acid transport system permease protein